MQTCVYAFVAGLLLWSSTATSLRADALEKNFIKPPPEARPWVYWFWLNGNITSNGVTADLEAMKQVGIGGALIMEVDQGAPVGPVDFMSARWRELFGHVHAEASRLGLEINMNNDAGWNGSGGPWITPAQSMQKVVWSETNVTGPVRFDGVLNQPQIVAGYYRDIAVVAFPAPGAFRIDRVKGKALFETAGVGGSAYETLPPEMVIPREKEVTLTKQMETSGRLAWDVPPGSWTILRLGHTCTGVENAPAPKSGRGLECDKLSREGIEANFAGMMAKLTADTGIKPGQAKLGLVATHIDSWENGSQNWTVKMREEFQRRRGYNMMPFLPVMTGRVVDSLEISERFLWDLRQTVSEMVIENYAGRMRELAHANGMRFTVEAYGSPCDAIPYGGQSDEPMGEFWTPSGSALETCKGMASAGHVYGKRIIGAEAFTSGDLEKWREHPAAIKALGDRAFCEGINRFVFHRYALQPWAEERRPGMTMGPWGQHYERTQTWWDWSTGWHEYLARCQYLLRRGLFVADICYLQPEHPPLGFNHHDRNGYDWDECTAEAVIQRLSVKDGRIVLPDGMSYRLLVLPNVQTMTPALLRKLTKLVEAGATVIGPRPSKSPSLAGFPDCDAEIQRLAATLWGNCDGQRVKEHRFGQGRVIWGLTAEKVLAEQGIAPDFSSGQPLRCLHRQDEETHLYFVANSQPYPVTTTCSFRVMDLKPELWWPDSGRIEPAPLWRQENGVTYVTVSLEPSGSTFVIFRERAGKADSLVMVKRDGKTVLSATPEPPMKVVVKEARYGVLDDPQRTRDVTRKVQRQVDGGAYDFPVKMMAEGDDPARDVVKTLVVEYAIDGVSHTVKARDPDTIYLSREAVKLTVEKARYGVLDDPKRTRDLREQAQSMFDAGQSTFRVAEMAKWGDPAFLVVKTLELEFIRDGKRHRLTGTDPEMLSLVEMTAPPPPVASVRTLENGKLFLAAREPGEYECATASGKTFQVTIPTSTPAVEVGGPWQVRFAPGGGAPASEVTFAHLMSWTEHGDPGIKYFSGEATYTQKFSVPQEMRSKDKRVYLDLGKVQAFARVKLNRRDLGILWKPPFRMDITEFVKPGNNSLEIQVVNLWPNRMIGDEQLPEDSERNPDGTLKRWPQWLLDGKPSPAGRFTFTSWRLWKKQDALLESGLVGPVTLSAHSVVPVKLSRK